MRLNKTFLRTLFAIIIACGTFIPVQGQNSIPKSSSMKDLKNFQGLYEQVNQALEGYITSFSLDGNEFILSMCGLFDVDFVYHGEAKNVESTGDGISFDTVLIPNLGFEYLPSAPAHINLTHSPSGVYELQLTYEAPAADLRGEIEGTTTLFKIKDDRIDGTVPAKIGKKVSIAGLLKSLAPYVHIPELMATVRYLNTHSGLSDTEAVRQDENNRYLEYAWGELNQCLESKYWFTDDGNILLVLNVHDATYEYPQTLRFFLFDKDKGALKELPTALSDKWPWEPGSDNNGICYQVRYYSDGIVALVPETNGDSFDVVTLKFDGKIFR